MVKYDLNFYLNHIYSFTLLQSNRWAAGQSNSKRTIRPTAQPNQPHSPSAFCSHSLLEVNIWWKHTTFRHWNSYVPRELWWNFYDYVPCSPCTSLSSHSPTIRPLPVGSCVLIRLLCLWFDFVLAILWLWTGKGRNGQSNTQLARSKGKHPSCVGVRGKEIHNLCY